MSSTEKISFTVDAGIINRLGLELVSKSETALAELIKNSYDADARKVDLFFIDAERINGTLVIEDTGVGMDREQLINGFMKLATTDKIHNSISDLLHRPKAGRKGIGRFSTQRLGIHLEIITRSYYTNETLKLEINWENYTTDRRIEEIENELTLNYSSRDVGSGTTLIIGNLRDKWTDADIKRVYRYISDLIQPNLLKIATNGELEELIEDKSFEVNFYRKDSITNDIRAIADPQLMILDKSLATFSGYIDSKGFGICTISTKNFLVGKVQQKIEETFVLSAEPYELLRNSNISFKAYYFIGGDRNSYYGISKQELKTILEHLDRNGGVKLYRNGFRVPKYGENENDWLNIDKNYRIGQGIPYNNNRLIGFVQIMDSMGVIFEESAGREGLIEKDAFKEMQSFVSSGIEQCFRKFANWFRATDEYKVFNPDKKVAPSFKSIIQNTTDLKVASKILNNPDSSEEEKTGALILIDQAATRIYKESTAAINELEMIRVLAGTGLTIGEFVHEIKQIVPSIKGYLTETINNASLGTELLDNFKLVFEILSSLESYMSYFDETISKNVIRELEPIDIRKSINSFLKIVEPDIKRRNFNIYKVIEGRDLFTTLMHPSELNTVLQNLYSNSKKAILRSGNSASGKILVKVNRNQEKNILILQFLDNGSGIKNKDKDKIFDPFFTTSTKNDVEWGTGTGLGLYLLSQILKNRGGEIYVNEPLPEYNTNITIEIPITNKEDLKNHGY
jgi:signal transduction histidine kinase